MLKLGKGNEKRTTIGYPHILNETEFSSLYYICTNSWYLFNDSQVEKVNIEKIMFAGETVYGESIFSLAHMLVYEAVM